MEALVRTLYALAPPLWTAAAAAYLLVFLHREDGAERWARRLAFTALGVQIAAFVAVAIVGLPPVSSFGGVLFGVAFATGAVYLWLENRLRTPAIGVFPVVLVAAIAIAGSAAGDPLHPVSPAMRLWTTAAHLGGAILGYAGLLLAAVFGLLYLIQRNSLKNRRFGLFWERLPALELLDQFMARSLASGFAFLTVTLTFGHLSRSASEHPFAYSDPKIWTSNVLWLLVAIVLAARGLGRLRPAIASGASIALFTLALTNMVIVSAFSSIPH